LHKETSVERLVQATIATLTEGIGADVVKVWVIGAGGRLRCAGSFGVLPEDRGDSHVLASLTVERNAPLLVEQADDSEDASLAETVHDGGISEGTALGVPIPGHLNCRGAIECFCSPDRGLFSRSALDFSVAVAHQFGMALESCEHRERLEQAKQELRRRASSQTPLVGSSDKMERVREQIARVGPSAATVLVIGESGTGKELAARSIHDHSRHRGGPFVAVNCAAFCESLLESELFGHEAGAFTGADRRRVGQFERAHRGTIFLDEIGEMSANCQAKLLRVLEGHPFERLGGQEFVRVDVRILAATHQDLSELVRKRRFREDLYYRMRVVEIRLPPLRERDDDVVDLACLFLEQFRQEMSRGPSRLSSEAIDAIRRYHWPGNVRELKNAVERAVVMGRSEVVAPADLGLPPDGNAGSSNGEAFSLKEAERRHIESVLRRVGGNKVEASRILGIARGTLYKKMKD
jgi:Nif-specific regulatory protein